MYIVNKNVCNARGQNPSSCPVTDDGLASETANNKQLIKRKKNPHEVIDIYVPIGCPVDAT